MADFYGSVDQIKGLTTITVTEKVSSGEFLSIIDYCYKGKRMDMVSSDFTNGAMAKFNTYKLKIDLQRGMVHI